MTETRIVIADEERNLDITLRPSNTDAEVNWGCLRSTLQLLWIYCSRAVTVKVNSATEPDQVITLTDGQAISWATTDGADSCPFTVDVTKLYLTTVGGTTGSFVIRSLSDVTP
jgi:hypothetical protein